MPLTQLLAHPTSALSAASGDVFRSYEDAATAIGRLDASGKLAADGLRELLVLRCIATPTAASSKGMIALVRADGEGDPVLLRYGNGLRAGAARARGGAPPTVATLRDLLGMTGMTGIAEMAGMAGMAAPMEPAVALDELFRDAHERTPPVLKAALAAFALRQSAAESENDVDADAARRAALAVTLVLCVGGAITDAWLTLPRAAALQPHSPAHPSGGGDDPAAWLGKAFAALAREARAAERGLTAARDLAESDERRVRDALGRAAYSALDVLALMRAELVISVPETARALGLTPPTAGAAVARLVELGIAVEVTGKARSRAFAYEGLVRALEPEQSSRE